MRLVSSINKEYKDRRVVVVVVVVDSSPPPAPKTQITRLINQFLLSRRCYYFTMATHHTSVIGGHLLVHSGTFGGLL